MLLNSFFFITDSENNDGVIKASLRINETHDIFKGHFPDQPIVPGVCMMQIAKEVLENTLNINTQLLTADHLKFLKFINPNENNLINLELKYLLAEGNTINVTAFLLDSTATYFKFKGVFTIKEDAN